MMTIEENDLDIYYKKLKNSSSNTSTLHNDVHFLVKSNLDSYSIYFRDFSSETEFIAIPFRKVALFVLSIVSGSTILNP